MSDEPLGTTQVLGPCKWVSRYRAKIYLGIRVYSCERCGIEWYGYDYLAPAAWTEMIECDLCMKVVFGTEPDEAKYLERIGAWVHWLGRKVYSLRSNAGMATLPPCTCGGKFIPYGMYHTDSPNGHIRPAFPLCPLCRDPHTSVRETPSRKEWAHIPYVNYMNRLNGFGPNNPRLELLPPEQRLEALARRLERGHLVIGQGLIGGKFTIHF